jgi:hypothetical protein
MYKKNNLVCPFFLHNCKRPFAHGFFPDTAGTAVCLNQVDGRAIADKSARSAQFHNHAEFNPKSTLLVRLQILYHAT